MSETRKSRKLSQKKMQQKFDLHEVPAFAKKLRGYDPEEVDHYLNALVDAYLNIYAECEELRSAADEHRLFKEKVAHVLIEKELVANDEVAGCV